jgi:hypothetical protein
MKVGVLRGLEVSWIHKKTMIVCVGSFAFESGRKTEEGVLIFLASLGHGEGANQRWMMMMVAVMLVSFEHGFFVNMDCLTGSRSDLHGESTRGNA